MVVDSGPRFLGYHLHPSFRDIPPWAGGRARVFMRLSGPLSTLAHHPREHHLGLIEPLDTAFWVYPNPMLDDCQEAWWNPRDEIAGIASVTRDLVLNEPDPGIPRRCVIDVEVSLGDLLSGSVGQFSIREVKKEPTARQVALRRLRSPAPNVTTIAGDMLNRTPIRLLEWSWGHIWISETLPRSGNVGSWSAPGDHFRQSVPEWLE